MRSRVTFAALAAVVAVACIGRPVDVDPTGPGITQGDPVVNSIVVTPVETTLTVGLTVQLTVSISPAMAATVPTWSSSDSSVATVSATGLVTAAAAGKATISAVARTRTASSIVNVTAPPPPPPPPPPPDPVLVAAGDIATCSGTGDEATADLIESISGTVASLGDNVYNDGTLAEYTDCYGPSWGRHKARTKPAPGNHEYNTPNATGYFAYFGSAAGDPSKGYYSYDLGAWHIIVLNSNMSCTAISCAPGSPQDTWLRADLAAHSNVCTLAYWHHPRFNSGARHGNDTTVANFWNALYAYGADVVLNGHDHIYERFAPQTPNAVADPVSGIRQFTVGTGGASHYSIGVVKANSEVRNSGTWGVLKLTLRATSYDWEFVPVAGASFGDSGTGQCHR